MLNYYTTYSLQSDSTTFILVGTKIRGTLILESIVQNLYNIKYKHLFTGNIIVGRCMIICDGTLPRASSKYMSNASENFLQIQNRPKETWKTLEISLNLNYQRLCTYNA